MDIEFFIPPGLEKEVTDFQARLIAADTRGRPHIMIFGESGVGKSLFIEVYKQFYSDRYKDDQFKVVNCSFYHAQDPKIIQGELFGVKKGAHSEAKEDKLGVFHLANGGVLVLEEIGELPQQIQAQLLTFIDSGKIQRVGGTISEKVEVRLLGTTNRQEALQGDYDQSLRRDFFFRFSKFTVAPLHKRRNDILYYLLENLPQFLLSLKKSELFMLLSHNWPGNVRELEEFLINVETNRILAGTSSNYEDLPRDRLALVNETFDTRRLKSILMDLERNGTDVELIRKHLAPYGIDFLGDDCPFSENDKKSKLAYKVETLPALLASSFVRVSQPHSAGSVGSKFQSKVQIKTVVPDERLNNIYKGIESYCTIFHVPVSSDANLLDLKNAPLQKSDSEQLQPTIVGVEGLSLEALKIYDYRRRLKRTLESRSEDTDDISPETIENFAIEYLLTKTEREVLELYYTGLAQQERRRIGKEHGVMTAVCKRAGFDPKSEYKKIRVRFDKYVKPGGKS